MHNEVLIGEREASGRTPPAVGRRSWIRRRGSTISSRRPGSASRCGRPRRPVSRSCPGFGWGLCRRGRLLRDLGLRDHRRPAPRAHIDWVERRFCSFYGRRVRRILPAATLVIIAAVIASYALLGPVSGEQTAGDARWASVFLINVHFAVDRHELSRPRSSRPRCCRTIGRSQSKSSSTWSTPRSSSSSRASRGAVSLRRRLGIVLGVAVVASFVASDRPDLEQSDGGVLLTLPRVWELALGGLVAVSHGPPAPGAGARRSGAVVARPRHRSCWRQSCFSSSTVLPRMGGGPPGGRSGARHRGRRRHTDARGGASPPAATVPVDRARLVFAVPVALAGAHHRAQSDAAPAACRSGTRCCGCCVSSDWRSSPTCWSRTRFATAASSSPGGGQAWPLVDA